jgi:hypothetical protein
MLRNLDVLEALINVQAMVIAGIGEQSPKRARAFAEHMRKDLYRKILAAKDHDNVFTDQIYLHERQ